MSREIQGFAFLTKKIKTIQSLLGDNNADLLPIIRKETYQFLQVVNKGYRGIKEIEIVEEYNKDVRNRESSQKD